MASKCRACGRFSSVTDGIKCTKCAVLYHKACVNIPKEARASPSWQCPECKIQTPRKDNSEDPVRGEGADFTSQEESLIPDDKLAVILKEVRLHRAETKLLQDDLRSMRAAFEGFSSRLGDIEARVTDLEKKCSESDSNPSRIGDVEYMALRSCVDNLKAELNERDQEAFCNDVEITGIPEEQHENLVNLVTTVGTKLGIALEPRDVVIVERTGMRRAPLATSSGSGPNEASSPLTALRPRPLVLRVARRQLRDAILQAARVRRNLSTEGMGLAAATTRVYINERLSRLNKFLFYKAREMARARGWKHVWSRDGRIFVRRETGKASFRVRSEQDIEKIFGGQGK